jgi:SNF2 family DNA or RNA helicase
MIFDQAHNVLVYPALARGTSDLILQYIPEARAFNGSSVGVPRTLRNSQVLRWLGHPVVPVIDSSYDWPHAPGINPYDSQKVTSNFLVLHPRCFCLSDMGVGKTLATLWAADWLMKQHAGMKALIVCPLSIMQRVWGDAIFKNFLNKRTFAILHGSASRRDAELSKNVDFYIVNFDGVGVGAHTHKRFELDGFSKRLADRQDIRLVIVDEASAYKDAGTKRHKLARQIIGQRDYLWLLTGTPTPTAPTDAYGLAKLVNNAYGKGKEQFRNESMIKVSNFIWKPQKDGYEKARKLLTPSIRFDIKDVWDGPEMTVQQRQVELTAEQKHHMAALKRDLQVVVKAGHPITAVNEAAVRTKFIQISLGAIYDHNHVSHTIDASTRIDELRAVIQEAPSKILIFVGLTNVVNLLYKELGPKKDAKGRVTHHGWTREIINGETSQRDRNRIFRDFQQSDNPRVLIADPGTMAHGLDLYAAQTVIWFGPTDKCELYLQANKRAHRPGQKWPVTVVQIVSNKLEQEIYRRLENNESLQGALLSAVQRGDL